jgi:predicted RNA-binding protein with PUA-like domain
MMNYWLLKSEPDTFSIDDLAASAQADHRVGWSAQLSGAQHAADSIKKGDSAFFYHSSCDVPGIAGIVSIVKEGYPDKTAFDPKHHHYDADKSPTRSALVRHRCEAGAQVRARHHAR